MVGRVGGEHRRAAASPADAGAVAVEETLGAAGGARGARGVTDIDGARLGEARREGGGVAC